MTLITFSDGKPVMRDDKVGTEQACCCGCDACSFRLWGFAGRCPSDTQFEDTCAADQATADWMKSALEEHGYTVSVTDWPPCAENICEDNTVPCDCSRMLTASCFGLCGLEDLVVNASTPYFTADHDYANDPAWFELSSYGGGNPGLPLSTVFIDRLFYGCGDVAGEETGIFLPTAGDLIWMPVCNPLP